MIYRLVITRHCAPNGDMLMVIRDAAGSKHVPPPAVDGILSRGFLVLAKFVGSASLQEVKCGCFGASAD